MILAVVHPIHGSTLVAVGLSLASAASYGAGAALQHRATSTAGSVQSARALARLGQHPTWLLGSLFDAIGYLFQFLALRQGSLVLVEPFLVLSLVFAMPIAALIEGRRISLLEVTAGGLTAAGLAAFLVSSRPSLGHATAHGSTWIELSCAVSLACAGLAIFARSSRSAAKRAAVLYAAGSGIAFGYVAAITQTTGHLLDHGALHVLETWVPYVLLLGGVVALILTQWAFDAGVLRLSLPTLTICQPLVALAIGVGMFSEKVHSGGLDLLGEAFGFCVMIVGAYWLTSLPNALRQATLPSAQAGDATECSGD